MYGHMLMYALVTQKSCAVGMHNAKLGNHLNMKVTYMYINTRIQIITYILIITILIVILIIH